MTVEDFSDLFAQNKKVKEIAAIHSRDPAAISRALKSHRYTYQVKNKGVHFLRQGKHHWTQCYYFVIRSQT